MENKLERALLLWFSVPRFFSFCFCFSVGLAFFTLKVHKVKPEIYWVNSSDPEWEKIPSSLFRGHSPPPVITTVVWTVTAIPCFVCGTHLLGSKSKISEKNNLESGYGPSIMAKSLCRILPGINIHPNKHFWECAIFNPLESLDVFFCLCVWGYLSFSLSHFYISYKLYRHVS